MKVLPEESSELLPIIVRAVVLALVAYFATGRAEDVAAQAQTGLTLEETREEKDSAWRNYGDYVLEVETGRAQCDAALEAFARHRDDAREYRHVFEECHSEGEMPESP